MKVDLGICSFFNLHFDIWYDHFFGMKDEDTHSTIPSHESPSTRRLVETQISGAGDGNYVGVNLASTDRTPSQESYDIRMVPEARSGV
jgi:hypothetical protein